MVQVPNGNANNEVNRKIILIDRKLKDAFSNVKKDIKSIKGSLEKQGNVDKKELNNYNSDFEKNINFKIKKIEEEFLQKKFEKEDVDSKLSSFKSFLLNNLKDIKREIKKTKQPDKRSKVLHYLKKQIEYFRSKLEKSRQKTLLYKLKLKQEKKIQKLTEKFSADKGKKEESIYENSLISQLEWYKDRYGHIEKKQKDIENLKRDLESEYKKDRIKLEKEKKDIVNSYEKKLDLIEISNKQYQQFIINRIEESQKNFNEILSKNEEKFEKIIKDLDKKRQEDNIFLLKQFSSLNKESSLSEEIKKEEKPVKRKVKIDYIGMGKTIFFNVIPYVFLVILAVISLNQFFKLEFVTEQNTRLVILGIVTGGLTFWKNRKKVEVEMDKEKKDEELKEEIRKREFSIKFPKLNKIPILKNIAKWMYKEGVWVAIFLLILFVLSIVLTSLNYNRVPEVDEFNHLIAGKAIFQNGFSFYERAPFINYLIEGIINLFGYSLFWIRFPFIIVGSLIVFTIYLLGKKISKGTGLMTAYLWVISPWTIVLSIFIREYIIFTFLGTIILLVTINSLERIWTKDLSFKNILPLLVIFLLFIIPYNFFKAFTNYYLLLPLFIFPIIIYLLLIIIKKKELFERNKMIIYTLLIVILLLFLFVLVFKTSGKFDFNIYFNTNWFRLFFDPFINSPVLWYSQMYLGYFIGLIFLFVFFLITKNRVTLSYVLVYLAYLTAFIFLFKPDEWFTPRYIMYSFPLFVLIISYGCLILGKTILTRERNKFLRITTLIIMVFLFFNLFSINNTYFALHEPYQLGNDDLMVTGYKHLAVGELIGYFKANVSVKDPIVTTYFNRGMMIWYLDLNTTKLKSTNLSGITYDTSDTLFEFEELESVMKNKTSGSIVLLSSLKYLPKKDIQIYGRNITYIGVKDKRYDVYRWYQDDS